MGKKRRRRNIPVKKPLELMRRKKMELAIRKELLERVLSVRQIDEIGKKGKAKMNRVMPRVEMKLRMAEVQEGEEGKHREETLKRGKKMKVI